MSEQTFVIVGAGQASAWACKTLRQEGFGGRIVLVGEEPLPPYERPPLSKEFLRGEKDEPKRVLPEEWYGKNGVELRTGCRAEAVDAGAHRVLLEGAEALEYDRLLLCTGGRVRRLPVPGADHPGVHYLRTQADSRGLREALARARRVVLVGAGFIGLEVAASARKMGLEVTCLEMLDKPLLPIVGEEVADFMAAVHREQGVDLRLQERVQRLDGLTVVTDRSSFEADAVVVGVGIVPNVEIARGTAIQIDDGLVVDEFCRTHEPDVFAAGDVARFWHPVLGEHVRFEHWANANGMGAAAARNMLGLDRPYEDLPWFWTDQYDLNVQMVGHTRHWDRVVLRGTPESRSFTAFYLREGRLRMALAVNRFKDIRAARPLIAGGGPVDPEALADEGANL